MAESVLTKIDFPCLITRGTQLDLDDPELVRQIEAGSADAFEELVRRHRRLVYRIAYGITQEHQSAMDVLQETFLKAYERLGSRRAECRFQSWLARIAANEAMNRSRADRLRTTEPLDEGMFSREETPFEKDLIRREEDEALHRSLETLPPRQRLAVVLRYFQEMSTRDIAAVLNCSEDTARNTLLRSLRKLRLALVHSGEPLS